MRTVGGIEDAEEVGFKEVRFVIVLLDGLLFILWICKALEDEGKSNRIAYGLSRYTQNNGKGAWNYEFLILTPLRLLIINLDINSYVLLIRNFSVFFSVLNNTFDYF